MISTAPPTIAVTATAEDGLRTDHHGPPRFRTDGPIAHMPEFAAAFGCRAGSKMVRLEAERCRLW